MKNSDRYRAEGENGNQVNLPEDWEVLVVIIKDLQNEIQIRNLVRRVMGIHASWDIKDITTEPH